MDQSMKCGCPHHKMISLLAVLFGIMFLLHNAWGTFSNEFVQTAWPVLIILAGLQKMFRNMCTCCAR